MELGTTLYLQVNATHVDVLAAVNGVLSNSVLTNNYYIDDVHRESRAVR